MLLADDHEPTREDIRLALEQDARFVVCAEAPDAPAAVQEALRAQPDVCLLDVNMPGGGVAAAWEISSRLPTAKVVMLTVSREDVDLISALRAGAEGYLLKDMDPRSLPRALDGVLRGEVAIPRDLVGRVVDLVRDRSARRRSPMMGDERSRLTSREWEVLALARDGLTTAQIARRLTLEPVTVRTHLSAIRRKLGDDAAGGPG